VYSFDKYTMLYILTFILTTAKFVLLIKSVNNVLIHFLISACARVCLRVVSARLRCYTGVKEN
jgi:hypothetical protein